jgi:two-component system phosphate regulon sensor histidine kinase PhoR
MSTTILIALAAALLALIWLTFRHLQLLRKLAQYTRSLAQTSSGDFLNQTLPTDVEGMVALSNTVYNLSQKYKKHLGRLNAENARLQATLNQMTDGILISDALGRIQMANPAAESMFGEGQTLIGKTVSLALRHHQLIEAWRKCQQYHEVVSDSVELSVMRKFLQIIAIPDEHAGGTILLIQDLTRIRRLETVRRDFISNVSHELRTPLASLKALTETLQDGAMDDPPAAQRFLGRIQTEVDALTHMATELLELSRIESGQVPLDRKPVQPFTLLNSAADRMRLQVERAGLDMQVNCFPDLPFIRVDLPRLEQVLVNLIHNAAKFTPAGGSISLAATKEGNFIRFSVQDTGLGIPADDLSRIFERFYRVDRSRAGGGTGLGLSIAKHLVEAHAGSIWAESRESNGSTFYFTIPVYPG